MNSKLLKSIQKKTFSLSFLVISLSGTAQNIERNGFTQILLKPKANVSQAALDAMMSAQNSREKGEIPALGVKIIEVPSQVADKVVDALNRNHNVEYAEHDVYAHAIATNDPYSSNTYQWYLNTISAPQAWGITSGSSDIVVSVVDTGVNASHPDLVGKVLAQDGYDFANNDSDASDDNGHGTAAAGCISPTTNNNIGIAGVSWNAKILPVKALWQDGSGSHSAIANAISYSADYGADIINLSLGGPTNSRTLNDAVQYAWNKGAVIIAAAGNEGNTIVNYPAGYNNVVAVSATNESEQRASFSSYGSFVDISAPGDRIATLALNGGYVYQYGTSFASPIVAGVASLIASSPNNLSNNQIVDILTSEVDDLGASGYDIEFGHGRVNALKAVEAAFTTSNNDTISPVVSMTGARDGDTVSGTITLEIDANDDTSVERIELFVNGQKVGETSGSRIVYEIDTLQYTNGALEIQAQAFDTSGNVGTLTHTYTVNNTNDSVDDIAPASSIISPTNGDTISGRSVNIYTQSNDNIGVSLVELYVDGALYSASTNPNATFSWNIRKVADGAHTLQTIAYDLAGNHGASQVLNITKVSSGGRGNRNR